MLTGGREQVFHDTHSIVGWAGVPQYRSRKADRLATESLPGIGREMSPRVQLPPLGNVELCPPLARDSAPEASLYHFSNSVKKLLMQVNI